MTIGGLLHDVGKMNLSRQLLEKPSSLTEMEYAEIKKHPLYAYDILVDQDIDEQIKRVALMHHERNDGSGYPRGLKEEQIDEMVSIVAIVDVFDAMTSNRPYRKGICPFTVIDILLKEGNSKFNYVYLHRFLGRIAYSYLNEYVKLSNGMKGEIVAINDRDLSRPMISVDGQIIDLSTNRGFEVVEVITRLSETVSLVAKSS